jgi:hypothetical protein
MRRRQAHRLIHRGRLPTRSKARHPRPNRRTRYARRRGGTGVFRGKPGRRTPPGVPHYKQGVGGSIPSPPMWKLRTSPCCGGSAASCGSRRRFASTSRPPSRTTTPRRRAACSRSSRSTTHSAGTWSSCSRPGNVLLGAGPVAQLVEQGTFNPKVAGSIPARPIAPELAPDHARIASRFAQLSRDAGCPCCGVEQAMPLPIDRQSQG